MRLQNPQHGAYKGWPQIVQRYKKLDDGMIKDYEADINASLVFVSDLFYLRNNY
jgi:hypothetical protein